MIVDYKVLELIILCIFFSVLSAWITTKAMSGKYLNVIDNHVKAEHQMIKDFIQRAEHMLEEKLLPKE